MVYSKEHIQELIDRQKKILQDFNALIETQGLTETQSQYLFQEVITTKGVIVGMEMCLVK